MVAVPSITPELVNELEEIESAQDLLGELFKRFGERAAIGTSGQLTGAALIDLAVASGAKPRVFAVDTGRLFPETYEYFQTLEERYDLSLEHFGPDPGRLKKMIQEKGENLFFDSKANQELCCRLRKVEPNQAALDTLDVWVTGLRADQSQRRAQGSRLEINSHYGEGGSRPILKAAPLQDWTEARVRDYLVERKVPTHPLLEWEQDGWRYDSLGCVICTTPTGPKEPKRAGRWRWFNAGAEAGDKECGIHLPGAENDE